MQKQYFILVVLIVCLMRTTGALAEESTATYLSATKELTLFKVLSSQDTYYKGPFILGRTGTKVILRPNFKIAQIQIDPKIVDTTTWPSIDLGLTFLDIPEVEIIQSPNVTLYYHAVLDFLPGDSSSPISLNINSLYLTRAEIKVTGEGHSNNLAAEFDLINPTLTITRDTFSLHTLLQIRDKSNTRGLGESTLKMPYDIKDGNNFTYIGKAGNIKLFPGAENESLNDPTLTFVVDEKNVLSSVNVEFTHNIPPHVQNAGLILNLPPELDLGFTAGGPIGFHWP